MVDCHGLNYRDHILVENNPISVNNDSETTHRSSIYTLSYLKFNLESIDVYIVGSGQILLFDRGLPCQTTIKSNLVDI